MYSELYRGSQKEWGERKVEQERCSRWETIRGKLQIVMPRGSASEARRKKVTGYRSRCSKHDHSRLRVQRGMLHGSMSIRQVNVAADSTILDADSEFARGCPRCQGMLAA